ncbi:MAG TPA: ferrochelatase [Acidobacteriota bacterium]|nr:ferrochelatase [Acidobacteriota bacterium]
MAAAARTGVLLLAMGGPESPAEIQPYLQELLRDPLLVPLPGPAALQELFARKISRRRAPQVAARYAEAAGGASPLNPITRRQAAGLEERLRRGGGDWCVAPAFRYQPAFTDESVRRLAEFRPERVVALPLYPFYSRATSGSSLEDARARWTAGAPAGWAGEWLEIRDWSGEPGYLDWLAGRATAELERLGFAPAGAVVLPSVHGLPESMVRRGDPYRAQVDAAIAGLRKRLGDWRVEPGFQSKFGPGRWLQPYTSEIIERLAAEGVGEVLMVPLGFVAENLETLWDMDRVFAQQARDVGIGRFARLGCPDDDPAFIEIMERLVRAHLGG